MNKPITPAKKATGIDFSALQKQKLSEKFEAPTPDVPRTAILASRIEAQGSQISQLKELIRDAQAGLKLDPKLITPSKWANRNELSFEGSEFRSLKEEIKASDGNVQPIKVRRISDAVPVKYEVVFGHRRHRACLELGIPVLAIIESVESLDDKKLFIEMDRENRQRADLRPYEQGRMYARALDEGMFPSMRQMSSVLGVVPSNASAAISIARLPRPILDAFVSPLDVQYGWVSGLNKAITADADAVFRRAKTIADERTSGQNVSSPEAFSRLCGVEKEVKKTRVVKLQGKPAFKVSVFKGSVAIELPALSKKALAAVEKSLIEALQNEGVLP